MNTNLNLNLNLKSVMPTTYPSLIDSILKPIVEKQSIVLSALTVIAGSFLIVLSAQAYISLPFTPVPITLQTLSVLLLGSLLGSKKAPMSVLLYILYGAVGFPVFSQHSGGLHVLYGATAGYIFGFMITSYVVGKFAERGWDRTLGKSTFVMFIAQLCIFVPGLLWLAQFVGFKNVLAQGLYPFVVGGLIKMLLASSSAVLAWKIISKINISKN